MMLNDVILSTARYSTYTNDFRVNVCKTLYLTFTLYKTLYLASDNCIQLVSTRGVTLIQSIIENKPILFTNVDFIYSK